MNIIVKETGEKRQIFFRDATGRDRAEHMLKCRHQFLNKSIQKDDSQDAVIAPLKVVEYWEVSFAAAKYRRSKNYELMDEPMAERYVNKIDGFYHSELIELMNEYDVNRVEAIYRSKMGGGTPKERMAAIEATRAVLRKRYNTETALLIGSYSSNLPRSDFRYYKESLYRQDTGEFFLVGKGGPMTAYGHIGPDDSIGYGERSIDITRAAAKAWADVYLDNPPPADCFEPANL